MSTHALLQGMEGINSKVMQPGGSTSRWFKTGILISGSCLILLFVVPVVIDPTLPSSKSAATSISLYQDKERRKVHAGKLVKWLPEPFPEKPGDPNIDGGEKTPRLFIRGKINGYKRGRHNQHPGMVRLSIEGLVDKENAAYYIGKKVAYVPTLSKKSIYKAGGITRPRKAWWGKIIKPHGNKGSVLAKFPVPLPSSSFMGDVRIMLYGGFGSEMDLDYSYKNIPGGWECFTAGSRR